MCLFVLFFFSSRRRHTRSLRDWSSDVCSSDLVPLTAAEKELAKGQGGYAREMGDDYKKRQAALIAERIKQADIVITTALIPGRPAPLLVKIGRASCRERV